MADFRILLGFSLSLSAFVFSPHPLHAAPDNDEKAIHTLCLAGFQTAFAQAGKQPPDGMGVFTCRCLVQRLQDGESLNPARESCKLEASRRFRILPKG